MIFSRESKSRKLAINYLERLQRETYESMGREPVPGSISERLMEEFGPEYFEKIGHPEHATYESFSRAYRAMKERSRHLVPTKFENPDWYSVTLEIAEKIDRIVEKHGYDLSRSKPLFGTLPSGNVNAMAIAIPGSFHRLILIEEGLFSFAHLVVKAVTAVFSSRDGEGGMVEFSLDEERVEKNLADSVQIQERFLDVIMSYLVKGHPHFAKPYLTDKRSSTFSSYLCDSLEVFVLAHEYGHLIFDSRTDKKDLQQHEQETNPNWTKEFAADTKGLEILLGVKMSEGYDLATSFAGADLFFGCIDVLNQSRSILKNGEILEDVGTESHPPIQMRKLLLRSMLQGAVPLHGSLPDQFSESVRNSLDLADLLDSVLVRLFMLVRDELAKAHREGIRPRYAWQ